MAGDQWLRVDAYMMAKPFTGQLLNRFGPAGVVTWIAFLAACKRSPIQGQITFASEAETRQQLFITDMPLVDSQGEEWTLREFFAFTGRMKQTRKTPHGGGDKNVYRTPTSRLRTSTERLHNVYARHWEHWQNTYKTPTEHLRKPRSEAPNAAVEIEIEKESEIEIENAGVTAASAQGAAAPPAETETATPAPPMPNGSSPDPAAVASLRASIRGAG